MKLCNRTKYGENFVCILFVHEEKMERKKKRKEKKRSRKYTK